MRSGAQHYQAIANGKRSKIAGEYWETILENSCEYFRSKGLAEIEKTPEPMRPISKPNSKGQFLAVFKKQAQPDFKGTIAGGRAIVFEAKHTESDRLQHSAVSEEQGKRLDKHMELGAACFVLISFRFTDFFRVPWSVFRAMKEIYGRKYITPRDIEQYRVKFSGHVVHFLPLPDFLSPEESAGRQSIERSGT